MATVTDVGVEDRELASCARMMGDCLVALLFPTLTSAAGCAALPGLEPGVKPCLVTVTTGGLVTLMVVGETAATFPSPASRELFCGVARLCPAMVAPAL